MNLSKSQYRQYSHCPKNLWLGCHKPQEARPNADEERRIADGVEVGRLARGMFGSYVDVTVERDGVLDHAAMLQKTQEALNDGAENICEATFCHDGCYCQVDILHKTDNGYEIYEVKSSTNLKQEVFRDIAFQRHVLLECGVPVCGTYLLYINKSYERQGELDLRPGGLLECYDFSTELEEEHPKDIEAIAAAKQVMCSDAEPQCKLSRKCTCCEFFAYCTRDLPQPSVLELPSRNNFKWTYVNNGICSMQQLLDSDYLLSPMERQQAEHAVYDKPADINKREIREFLSTLWYPLCFLDFETMQSAIPPFDGTRPYQQVPFQYSLHIVAEEGAPLEHKEFLAEPNGDPRRALAEQLTRDIPQGACVVAYNMSFEKNILLELADSFDDLAPRLHEMYLNARDIMAPFRARAYYNRAMHGSYSLKYVAPALFPDEKESDYRSLEGVHNGSEAMDVFPRMKHMSAEELATARKQLLTYCGYDTLNTVKIWRELVRVSK